MVGESARFRRQDRLLSAQDFKRVFADASKTSDRYFTWLARDNDLDGARMGLVVAKKNIKTAVARNHIKRLIRETFRLSKVNLPNRDFVVIAKFPAREAASPVLRASLERFWRRSAVHAHAIVVAD